MNTKSSVHIDDLGGGADVVGEDNTPAFNRALEVAQNEGIKTIFFGKGDYYFHSPPNEIRFGVTIEGHGKSRTNLIRAFSVEEGHPEDALIKLRTGANGSTVCDLSILAEGSSRGGSAISLVASGDSANGYYAFQNLYLSSFAEPGESAWDSTVFIDGTARKNAPRGVRSIDFTNCSIFGAKDHALTLLGAVALTFVGGGLFEAGGAMGGLRISGTEEVPSQYILFDVAGIGGVEFDFCNCCQVKSAVFAGPIRNTGNTLRCLTMGAAYKPIEANWIESRHVDTVLRQIEPQMGADEH